MCICIVFSDEGISGKLTIKVGSRRKGKRIGKYRIKWLIIPTTKIVPETLEKELRLYCFLRRQLLHWWFGRLIGLIWLTCCIRMSSLQRRPRGFFSGLPRVRKMEFLMSLECITDTSVKLSTQNLPSDEMFVTFITAIRSNLCVGPFMSIEMFLLMTYTRTKPALLLHDKR